MTSLRTCLRLAVLGSLVVTPQAWNLGFLQSTAAPTINNTATIQVVASSSSSVGTEAAEVANDASASSGSLEMDANVARKEVHLHKADDQSDDAADVADESREEEEADDHEDASLESDGDAEEDADEDEHDVGEDE